MQETAEKGRFLLHFAISMWHNTKYLCAHEKKAVILHRF